MARDGQDRETRSEPDPYSVRRALLQAWTLTAVALGAASGVAQLVTSGPGRAVLICISALAAVFIVVKLFHPLLTRSLARRLTELTAELDECRAALAEKTAELDHVRATLTEKTAELDHVRAALAEKTAEVDRYRAALRRVANPPQLELLEEELVIVVTIGVDGTEDHIQQRHRTTARPSLLYRMLRPVTPFSDRPTSYSDLRLRAESATEDLHLSVLPLSENTGGIWLLVLLQPHLAGTREWTIDYDSPDLWAPLRNPHQGVDTLGWNPRLGRDLTYADNLTKFEVQFIFPPNASGVMVRETGAGRGMQTADTLPSGQRRVVWIDNAPSVERYEWELSAAFTA